MSLPNKRSSSLNRKNISSSDWPEAKDIIAIHGDSSDEGDIYNFELQAKRKKRKCLSLKKTGAKEPDEKEAFSFTDPGENDWKVAILIDAPKLLAKEKAGVLKTPDITSYQQSVRGECGLVQDEERSSKGLPFFRTNSKVLQSSGGPACLPSSQKESLPPLKRSCIPS
ncbi:hypothetical protein DM01DRAFT_1381292, partial [Hesseltinella vesiculosa]